LNWRKEYSHWQWLDAEFQVNIHAIGDRANRAAVDAFENVLGSDCEGCNGAKRLRIEHAQIIVSVSRTTCFGFD
jgi:predicted amidohydrolase YtcJ